MSSSGTVKSGVSGGTVGVAQRHRGPGAASGPGLRSAHLLLNRAHTLPRELVHRRSVHEVLLLDTLRLAETEFAVAVQWPRSHQVAGGLQRRGLVSALLAEAVRQIGVGLCTRHLDVPADQIFLAHLLGYEWWGAPPSLASGPADATAIAALSPAKTGRGPSRVWELSVSFFDDGGTLFAKGAGRMTTVRPALYSRLRGTPALTSSDQLAPARDSALPPEAVGRDSASEVVVDELHLGAGSGDPRRPEVCTRLIIDPSHPFYFDHAYDHVPGILLLEAMDQTAALVPARGRRPHTAAIAHFHRYVDLIPAPTLHARRSSSNRVTVEVRQNDCVVAEGTVNRRL